MQELCCKWWFILGHIKNIIDFLSQDRKEIQEYSDLTLVTCFECCQHSTFTLTYRHSKTINWDHHLFNELVITALQSE